MARYEMKTSVVNAWQWDGTIAGAQAIQAQFGDAQEMGVFQSAKAGSVPMLQMRNPTSFGSTTAAPSNFVIMMSDGRSLQVMDAASFTAQYAPEADPTSASGSAGTTGTVAASGGQDATATGAPDAASPATPATGSAGSSP